MELQTSARAWREDPEDQPALSHFIHALERAGKQPPLDLLERLREPEQTITTRHPVDVWATLENGRSVRLGRGKPGAAVRVRIPECREWWLCESPEHPLSLEAIGEAARDTRAPGLELEAEGAGRLTDRLGPVPNLRRLRVSGQGYRARVFEGLEEFSSLRELAIAEAPEHPEETLSHLASCRFLTHLELCGRGYFPDSPAAWRGLEGLRSLRLSRADLWGRERSTLRSFEALEALEELRLDNCAQDESAFRALTRSPVLRRFQLRHQYARWESGCLRALPPSLREIDIDPVETDSANLSFLDGLPRLEKVKLWFSPCEDAIFERLARLPALRVFSALGCWDFTSDGVVALRRASKLEELFLGEIVGKPGRPGFDRSAWQALSELSRLRVLYLGYTGLDNRGLAVLSPLKRLETLFLKGCRGITNKGLAALSALPKLRDLTLGPGRRITAAGLEELRALKELERLSLVGCSRIGDAGLKALAALPSLRSLSLIEAEGHSVEGYAALSLAGGLERLELDRCQGFGEEALRAYATLPRLRELVIPKDSCSDAARRAFLEQLRGAPMLSYSRGA